MVSDQFKYLVEYINYLKKDVLPNDAKITVAGHSLGGFLAQDFTAHHRFLKEINLFILSYTAKKVNKEALQAVKELTGCKYLKLSTNLSKNQKLTTFRQFDFIYDKFVDNFNSLKLGNRLSGNTFDTFAYMQSVGEAA